MDSGLHHFCNREFVRGLKELRGRNVLLLLFDGSAVFGRIGGIDDWVVAIFPATGITGVTTVRFRPPNPMLAPVDILLSDMLIDACDICAVIEGPFIVPPISKACTAAVATNDFKPTLKNKPSYTRQQCKLVEELAAAEGQDVGVLLLGGWVVGGQLEDVDECAALIDPGTSAAPLLITIGAVNLFGPALIGGILSLFGTFRAWVNLKTLTSVMFP